MPSPNPTSIHHSSSRRSATRTTCRLAAKLLPIDAAAQDADATILDIGAGGAMLETHAPLTLGERWLLVITLADGSTRDSHVLVRRVVESNGLRRASVQFTIDPGSLVAAGLPEDVLASDSEALRAGSPPRWVRTAGIHAVEALRLRSLCGVRLRSTANVTIDESAVDCDLDVQGRVLADRASISGGTLHALRQVEVGELGSADGRRTIIILGRSEVAATMLADAERAIASLRVLVEDGKKRVALLSDQSAMTLSAADREAIMTTRFSNDEVTERLDRMQRNAAVIRERIEAQRAVKLVVGRTIHPGVEITAGSHTARFARAVHGPLTLQLDAQGELMRVAGDADGLASPLTDVASLRRAAA